MSKYADAVGRWAAVGPYYAMFPVDFAFEVVRNYSAPGDSVLDPFAGRASSIFAASALGRNGCGIEINPVGWLYGKVKLKPAPEDQVLRRLKKIYKLSDKLETEDLEALPEFFRACYCTQVLKFLITARTSLRWRYHPVDATLMAILLVYLHGKKPQALSNQMRQGKAMAPDYSLQWWKEHGHEPPEIHPLDFLTKRIEWRYKKGIPDLAAGEMLKGNCLGKLQYLAKRVNTNDQRRFNLLFTSPPYYNVTNYHYDQWLRLWLMGGPPRPSVGTNPSEGKFSSQTFYRQLMLSTFKRCSAVMSRDAAIYVRTDARTFTLETTIEALKKAFPSKTISTTEQPFEKDTQTMLYGDKEKKPGEIDILMQ